jgi:hypothetical protein
VPSPRTNLFHRRASFRALVALLWAWGALACSWRDDLDGERRVPEGANSTEVTAPAVSVVSDSRELAIDLFASRPLVTGHRRGALVIEAGTPDFVKYLDGGVRGDWRRGITIPSADGEQVASAVQGLAAEVYFPLDDDPGGVERSADTLSIRFRAKSAVKNQLVSVFLNERKLTDLRMPTTEWQTYAVKAGADSWVVGENKLRFYFRTAGEIAGEPSAAAFSRFMIGASLADEAAFAVGLGASTSGPGKGLAVNAASRLSYYLQLPETDSSLEFEVSSKSNVEVRIRKSGEDVSRVLWKGGAKPALGGADPALGAVPPGELGQPVEVELRSFRGELVRLDLISDGPATWMNASITVESQDAEAMAKALAKADRIILWSVSSLRSDRLRSPMGRGFQRFLDSAFVVPRMQAAVPSAGGSAASVMLGRFQTRGRIDKERTTLAERLQEHGFSTALISGNGFVNDAAGFSQGYGHYDNPMRRQHHFGAKTLWRQAKKFLLAHKSDRVFVHLATVEGHLPYRPTTESLDRHWQLPAPFPPAKTLDLAAQLNSGRKVPSETEKSYVRALYDASIRDSSAAFAAMIEELADLHLPGNTVIVLVGEHGEELWERGRFGHGQSLFQESLVTPLAISGLGVEVRPVPSNVTSLDVAPTILDLAGVMLDTDMQGRSVLDTTLSHTPRPLFSGLSDGSRAVRLGDYKLLNALQGKPMLYNLERDGREQQDLGDSRPIAVRALRITLSAFVAFEEEWSTARWGQPSAPVEAFARDLGF